MNDNANQDRDDPTFTEIGDNPPDYNQIAISPDGPPPSYESLFGRLKDARENSSGVYDFFQKVFALILATIGCAITLGISLFIPGASVIIGALYINDCPAEPMIPIFLIVSGVVGALNVLFSLYERHRLKAQDPNEPLSESDQALKIRLDCSLKIMKCFSFIWFIVGSVWVYRTNYDFHEDSGPLFCQRIVYNFAFWMITISYIILALWSCGSCCLFILYSAKTEDK